MADEPIVVDAACEECGAEGFRLTAVEVDGEPMLMCDGCTDWWRSHGVPR